MQKGRSTHFLNLELLKCRKVEKHESRDVEIKKRRTEGQKKYKNQEMFRGRNVENLI